MFGDGLNPTYVTGQSVVVDWDPSDPHRAVSLPTETLTPLINETVIADPSSGIIPAGRLIKGGA